MDLGQSPCTCQSNKYTLWAILKSNSLWKEFLEGTRGKWLAFLAEIQ